MTIKKKAVQRRRHGIMIYLPLDVKSEADRQAQAEGRSLSNCCAFLVRTGLTASGVRRALAEAKDGLVAESVELVDSKRGQNENAK